MCRVFAIAMVSSIVATSSAVAQPGATNALAPAPSAPSPVTEVGAFSAVSPNSTVHRAPAATRRGLTFEAGIGVAMMRAVGNEGESEAELAMGGLNLGVGAFLQPTTALSLRLAGGTFFNGGPQITHETIGPSLQQWISPGAWIGASAGLAIVRETEFFDDIYYGPSFGARLGYTFNPHRTHSMNMSAEVTTSLHDKGRITVASLLLGYQLL